MSTKNRPIGSTVFLVHIKTINGARVIKAKIHEYVKKGNKVTPTFKSGTVVYNNENIHKVFYDLDEAITHLEKDYKE